MKEPLALFPLAAIDPALADREESREARPGRPILRPDKERSAVHEIETTAGDQSNPGGIGGSKRLHEAADAVAIDDSERRIAE
jgi:hypothetical protein